MAWPTASLCSAFIRREDGVAWPLLNPCVSDGAFLVEYQPLTDENEEVFLGVCVTLSLLLTSTAPTGRLSGIRCRAPSQSPAPGGLMSKRACIVYAEEWGYQSIATPSSSSIAYG